MSNVDDDCPPPLPKSPPPLFTNSSFYNVHDIIRSDIPFSVKENKSNSKNFQAEIQIDLVKAVSKALAELNLVKSSEGTKFFLRLKKKPTTSLRRSFIKSIWNRLKHRKKEKKKRVMYDNDNDQVELTGYALVKTENVQRLIVASNDLIRFLFHQFCPQIHETRSEYRNDSFATKPTLEEGNVFQSYDMLVNLNRSSKIVNPEIKLQEAASNETLQQRVNELNEEQSKIDQCLLLTNCLIKPVLDEQSFDKCSVLQAANSFHSSSTKSMKYEEKSVLISIFDKMSQEKSKCNSFQDNRDFVRLEPLYDKDLQTAHYYPSSESNKIVDSSALVSFEKPIHAFSHNHCQLILKEESTTDKSFNLHIVADEFHSSSLKPTNGNGSSILVTFGDQEEYGDLGSSFQSNSVIPVCDSSFFIQNAKMVEESAISSSFIQLIDANSNRLPFGSSNSSLLSVVGDDPSYVDFHFPFQSSAVYSDFVSLSLMSVKRNNCEADNLDRTECDLVMEEFTFADENSEHFFDSTKYDLCS